MLTPSSQATELDLNALAMDDVLNKSSNTPARSTSSLPPTRPARETVESLSIPELQCMPQAIWRGHAVSSNHAIMETLPFRASKVPGPQYKHVRSVDPVPPLARTLNAMPTMQFLQDELLKQGKAIDQIKAENASLCDVQTVEQLTTSVQNLSEQVAAQAGVIKDLRTENASLRNTIKQSTANNASFEQQLSTMSDMQKLHNTASSAQQGHVNTLDCLVRTSLAPLRAV